MSTDQSRERGPTRPGDGATVSVPTHLACKLLASLRHDLTPGQRHAADELKRATNEVLTDESIALAVVENAPPAAPGAAAALWSPHPTTAPDGADAGTVLASVRVCAATWEGGARLVGNVRASDIVRAIDEVERRIEAAQAPASALPCAEAVAEALHATDPYAPQSPTWAEMLAMQGMAAAVVASEIANYRARAAAVLARLAATKTDGAALPVTVSDGAEGKATDADAILPLIGPLVDAFDQLPTDALDGECERLRPHLQRLRAAADRHHPIAPAGPGLAGAVRAYLAAVDAFDAFDAHETVLTPDEDGLCEGDAEHVRLRVDVEARRADLDSALDGGAGGGWRHHRTPAQVHRAAKADGLRAALGLVEGEDTERDAKGMGSPGRRLIRLIGDRLRGRIEAAEREPDGDQDVPPRSGQRGGDDA